VRIDRARGGELSVALTGTLSQGARSYAVDLDLATFVRDVIEELPGSRVLAPVHPTIGGAGTASSGPLRWLPDAGSPQP
jgi:hypothetical protein